MPNNVKGHLLTKHRDVPFVLCFKYPLERGYTFLELSQQNKKEFQSFLDKISRMSVHEISRSIVPGTPIVLIPCFESACAPL